MHRSSFTLVSASILALAALVLAALAPGAGAADATVDVYANDTPTAQNPNGTLTLRNWTPGERYGWNLTTETNYTTVTLRIHAGFDVDRGRQLVPLVDGTHFVEIHSHPDTVDRPAKVYNLTEGNASGVAWTYRLGVPGPTEGNLTLHRDVDAPSYELGQPRNVTHRGFDLTTDTSEVAMATLHIEPPAGSDEEPQSYSTPRPGPFQRFPVIGLEPETTYTYHLTFEDWSGNTVTTGEHTVTTAEAPNPPRPTVTPVSPLPNSTVEPADVVVEARWESPESPVVPGGVRMFVDKTPIPPGDLQIEGDTVSFRVPDPLPTRNVSAAVEVPNEAGGTGEARWSFQVQEATAEARGSPLGPAAALAGLAGAGLVAGRRRRG